MDFKIKNKRPAKKKDKHNGNFYRQFLHPYFKEHNFFFTIFHAQLSFQTIESVINCFSKEHEKNLIVNLKSTLR